MGIVQGNLQGLMRGILFGIWNCSGQLEGGVVWAYDKADPGAD